ncbi:MAG: LysR family transcriptional regulator [Clostridia bacterium]|nr:LysR family transcriptional regulator [Clostridia bacterium]
MLESAKAKPACLACGSRRAPICRRIDGSWPCALADTGKELSHTNQQEYGYFREVARTLSFSKAAEKLYISQPALSRCIVKLEKEFGAKLFIRDKHDVQLTAAGIALFNNYPRVMQAERFVFDKVQNAAQGLHSRLVIGIQEGQRITAPLKRALSAFEAKNPKVQMKVVGLLYNDLFDQLNARDIDVALSLEFPNIYPNIDCFEIERFPSYALVSVDHPAARCRDAKEGLQRLNGQDLMMVDWTIVPNVASYIVNQCLANGIQPANVRYAPSYYTLYSWLVMQYGFVVMNRSCLFCDTDICFIPLSPETGVRFCVYWHKDVTSSVVLRFVEHLCGRSRPGSDGAACF